MPKVRIIDNFGVVFPRSEADKGNARLSGNFLEMATGNQGDTMASAEEFLANRQEGIDVAALPRVVSRTLS